MPEGAGLRSELWRQIRRFGASSSSPPQRFVMSPTGTEKKRPPPAKVLSSQLRTAQSCGDSYVVRLGKGRSLAASPVWMQGTVLEVQLDRDSMLLMDETGTFTVQGVKSVPKGKPCLSPGTHTHVSSVCCSRKCRPYHRILGDIIRTWTHKNNPPERAPLLAAAVGRVL